MEEKKRSDRLMRQLREVETPEELMRLGAENGMPLRAEDAQACFDRLHQTGELSDRELDDVAGGGCGDSGPDPCPRCGSIDVEYRGNPLVSPFCKNCGKRLD